MIKQIFINAVIAIASTSAAVAQPFEGGAKSLFLGHSFFRSVAENVTEIVDASGAYPDYEAHIVFSGGQGGAPGSLWQNRQKKTKRYVGALNRGN